MLNSVIQSVLFDKQKWDLIEAMQWLKKHNFIILKVDETLKYIRFRQIEPKFLREHEYVKPHIKSIGDGIKFIIYYLNE
jgi:hypothetical protein